MNESVKKSLEKSKNVLEEKQKMVKRRICIKKTKTFTIIAMNFVQEHKLSFKSSKTSKKFREKLNIGTQSKIKFELNSQKQMLNAENAKNHVQN